ncbi:hypothetical protein EB796_004921 [Bugula neritina]|uniref:Uncharacterized protein n=1 Tax=Bugula neritina TaxID=10212 RepID=A0A7J7KFR9_BUGNE|nr:hypothetical protein EB796_014461 [Bugula neritina]KAF6036774.1 hypothetical protein EB796_004921 [Bugula neritina]
MLYKSTESIKVDGPGVTGRTQPVIGSTDIRKGPAKLIQYFKAYFPSNYVFAYYHYITTYLECAVTRTLLGEGYASHVSSQYCL